MQHIKSIKNFLTPSNSNGTQPPSKISVSQPTSPVLNPTENTRTSVSANSSPNAETITIKHTEQLILTNSGSGTENDPKATAMTTLNSINTTIRTSFNSKFNMNLNESTKRLSNLLQFNRNSSTTTAQKPANQTSSRTRPKFLRSNSFANNFKHKSREASLNDESTLSKKYLTQNEDIEPNLLFGWLSTSLDELIQHFQLEEDIDSKETLFMDTSETSSNTYRQLAEHGKLLMARCGFLYKQIESNAHLYDFSESIKANGYRSLLKIYESCCRRLLMVVHELNEKKNTFLFQIKLMQNTPLASNANLKDFQTWLRVMEKVELLFVIACDLQTATLNQSKAKMMSASTSSASTSSSSMSEPSEEPPTLFVYSESLIDSTIETNLFGLASVQEAFFGRACGFQFCDSLQMPLTGCAVALASYNDGYEAFSNKEIATLAATTTPVQSLSLNLSSSTSSSCLNGSPGAAASPVSPSSSSANFSSFQTTIGQAAKSLFSSTKYIMDPELRAKKISHVMKNANVEFCKAFWQLTETSIVQMGSNLVTPTLAVNVIKRIGLSAPLRLPRVKDGVEMNELVEVQPPKSSIPSDVIKIRILSHEMFKGREVFFGFNSFALRNSGKLDFLHFGIKNGNF